MARLKFLSVRAGSKEWGLPYKQLRAAVDDGRMPSVRLSKRPLLEASVLEAFIGDLLHGRIPAPTPALKTRAKRNPGGRALKKQATSSQPVPPAA